MNDNKELKKENIKNNSPKSDLFGDSGKERSSDSSKEEETKSLKNDNDDGGEYFLNLNGSNGTNYFFDDKDLTSSSEEEPYLEKVKNFLKEQALGVTRFAKRIPSRLSNLFENDDLLETEQTDEFIDSIYHADHQGQEIEEIRVLPSTYDIALFLLKNENLTSLQSERLEEKLKARIDEVFSGPYQDQAIQNFLNTTCFHILHKLQFHSLYELLPVGARKHLNQRLDEKIKSLFFVVEVPEELMEIFETMGDPEIMENPETKNLRFKLPDLETDRDAINFLKQLNTIFKNTIPDHPLARNLKRLILSKIGSVYHNLGGKTGEERLEFYEFYKDLINESDFFKPEEKKTLSKIWRQVKEDAEHYKHLSGQTLSIPQYGDELDVEIKRIKDTVEQNKRLYSSQNTPEQKRVLSDSIQKKLKNAGLKIPLANCDLIVGVNPDDVNLYDLKHNRSAYIRHQDSLFFKCLDEEDNQVASQIILTEKNLQLFDQEMKVNEGFNQPRNLTKTELRRISQITGHKPKVKESVKINEVNSEDVAGCDLLRFSEFPDLKEFWKRKEKEPLVSGVAYARVGNELYYVVADTKKWKKIEISEGDLQEFDLIMKKSGEMLLQSEFISVRAIAGHEPEIIENYAKKQSYSLETKEQFKLVDPYGTKTFEQIYLESVHHYLVDGDIKKIVAQKKQKIGEPELLDENEEGDDKHIISVLDIYSGLFSEDRMKNYEPDLYSVDLFLKGIFHFLAPLHPDLDQTDVGRSILAQNDLHAMKAFLIELAGLKSAYLERILPGFLLLAAKQDKLLLVTEAMRLITRDEQIIFNNITSSLCQTQLRNHHNLLIPSCALAFKILSRNNLNELEDMRNLFAVFENMAKVLSPSVFLECVHVLETKTQFLEWLRNERELSVFNNLKLRAEFAEKVRSNLVYSDEVIQRENGFVQHLTDLDIEVPEQGTLSDEDFDQFKNSNQLDLADLAYIKAKGLLSDAQIKEFLNEIGGMLEGGRELKLLHIRFIALYLDQEHLMRLFFSQTANREARNLGEDNVCFMDHISPDFARRVITAAQELSGKLSPENRVNYSSAFLKNGTQALKVLKKIGLFAWKSEQDFFTNLSRIPVIPNVDSSMLYYRHNGRLLLDPKNEKLPFYLYAKIREGVDNGVYSLEEVASLIKNILLDGEGNRGYAWGLFIAVFDKLQKKLRREEYEALEFQMLHDNPDNGKTFIKDIEAFLSFNFSVEKCLSYLDNEFFTNLLDKMTDDKPDPYKKSLDAKKIYREAVIKFGQIESFARSQSTKKPKEELPDKTPSEKKRIEIEKMDGDDAFIIDVQTKMSVINMGIYSVLEAAGTLSKDEFEALLGAYQPGAAFDWDLKYVETEKFKNLNEDLKKECKVPLHDKLSFSFLKVYFAEEDQYKKQEYLNQILLRMRPLEVSNFLDVNEEGHSLLMVAILNKDAAFFASVIKLFEEEEEGLKILLAAKDRYGRNIFYHLMNQERKPENEEDSIPLIIDDTFFNWSDDAVKRLLSTDCFLGFGVDGKSLLITAVELNNQILFHKILQTFEGKQLAEILNAKDSLGKNLLHYLLKIDQLDWLSDEVKKLLDVDVFLNFDDAGRTLLVNAAISGDKRLFDWVLNTFNGENLKRLLTASDKEGCNVLYYLMKHGRQSWIESDIIKENFSDKIIQDCGDGFTPLHYALLEALDKKGNKYKPNLLMVLLNEFIPGKNFQNWKNIFKIMESDGLKPLQSAVLMFSKNLEDIEVAKENPQDMLRVVLNKAPKLNGGEKQRKNKLLNGIDDKLAINLILGERKTERPSELTVRKWWDKGFFGSKGVVIEELDFGKNSRDDNNSQDKNPGNENELLDIKI